MRHLICIAIFFISLPTFSYFYPQSYLESREEFQKIVESLREEGGFEKISLPIQSSSSENLTIDGLFLNLGDPDQKHLVIVTSGIHGVEAFTGAAIQIEFLKRFAKNKKVYSNTSFLFLHAINPHGFHNHRRVDESNIDLNRNFSATATEFSKKIPKYAEFESFINPKEPAASGFWASLKLFGKSIKKLLSYGKKQMTEISIGGQYQNPKGIYYGGQSVQENAQLVEQVFLKFGKSFQKIMHIDLHTGFGERGKLHFFSSQKVASIPGFDKIFNGFKIDKGSDDDFYKTSGDFSTFTLNVFKNKAVVIPMTFEFGTMDSQTIMGGFHSLKNMIYENQGFQYGYHSVDDEKKIKKDFLNMFNPSDSAWREDVVLNGVETLETVIQRFSKL